MTDSALGQNQHLACSFTESATGSGYTTISGGGDGLVSFDWGADTTEEDAGGGGLEGLFNQIVERSWSPTINVRSNSVNQPFFLPQHHGKTLFFEWGPLGNASGQPRVGFALIIRCPMTAPRGGITQAITGVLAKPPVFGTFA